MRACEQCGASVLAAFERCPLDGHPVVEVEVEPLVGRNLDRYRVEGVLGRGAMGTVFRARPPGLDRDLALKVLHAEVAANQTLVARLRREAEALSRIHHPNIVSVVDFVRAPSGLVGLVMEYLPGTDLATLIAEGGPLPPDRIRRLVRGILAGLGEAHEHGLIHRDVKPSNVIVVGEGEHEVPKLVDFGVVVLPESHPETDRLTTPAHVVGTPRYMAPEQVRDEPLGPATDLYGLGVTMFEMATGSPPFVGATPVETMLKHTVEPPPPLPDVGGLERLILGLLEKEPSDRPPSAEAALARLDAPPSPANRRRPVLAAALAAGVGLVALALGLGGRVGARTEMGAASATTIPGPASAEAPLREATAPPAVAPTPVRTRSRQPIGLEARAAEARRSPPRGARSGESGSEVPVRTPKGAKDPANAPDPTKLGRRLDRVLDDRGLSRLDLGQLPATRAAYRRWRRSAERGDSRSATRALQRLIPAARTAAPTTEVLEARLDRLLTAIRGSRRAIPPILTEDIEQRYFELRVLARDADTTGERIRVGRMTGLAEAKLQRYLHGE